VPIPQIDPFQTSQTYPIRDLLQKYLSSGKESAISSYCRVNGLPRVQRDAAQGSTPISTGSPNALCQKRTNATIDNPAKIAGGGFDLQLSHAY